jgi:hypothetical protein
MQRTAWEGKDAWLKALIGKLDVTAGAGGRKAAEAGTEPVPLAAGTAITTSSAADPADGPLPRVLANHRRRRRSPPAAPKSGAPEKLPSKPDDPAAPRPAASAAGTSSGVQPAGTTTALGVGFGAKADSHLQSDAARRQRIARATTRTIFTVAAVGGVLAGMVLFRTGSPEAGARLSGLASVAGLGLGARAEVAKTAPSGEPSLSRLAGGLAGLRQIVGDRERLELAAASTAKPAAMAPAPAAPRLGFGLVVAAGQPSVAPFPLVIDNARNLDPASVVVIRHLPAAATLSAGHRAGPNAWAISVQDLLDVRISLPAATEGYRIEIELLRPDGTAVAKAVLPVIVDTVTNVARSTAPATKLAEAPSPAPVEVKVRVLHQAEERPAEPARATIERRAIAAAPARPSAPVSQGAPQQPATTTASNEEADDVSAKTADRRKSAAKSAWKPTQQALGGPPAGNTPPQPPKKPSDLSNWMASDLPAWAPFSAGGAPR